jgi:ketosteroid isomerase-like protein
MSFATPQDVEDAFYDAIEEADVDAMANVWLDSDKVLCLLPMAPLQIGLERVLEAWRAILTEPRRVEIEIHHVQWIETGDLAIHFVEEHLSGPGQSRPSPPIYAINIYRQGGDGWKLLLHQNSPVPPPPGIPFPGASAPRP